MQCPLGRKRLVQVQHALHQADHSVVPRDVGGGGEVDNEDGEETTVPIMGSLSCARSKGLMENAEAGLRLAGPPG
jgi:hypothetical protein